jgi:hypothetical protein
MRSKYYQDYFPVSKNSFGPLLTRTRVKREGKTYKSTLVELKSEQLCFKANR